MYAYIETYMHTRTNTLELSTTRKRIVPPQVINENSHADLLRLPTSPNKLHYKPQKIKTFRFTFYLFFLWVGGPK